MLILIICSFGGWCMEMWDYFSVMTWWCVCSTGSVFPFVLIMKKSCMIWTRRAAGATRASTIIMNYLSINALVLKLLQQFICCLYLTTSFIFLCLDPVVCQCGRPGHIMLIWSLNVACVIRSQGSFHLSLQLFTQKGQGAWIWLDKSTRHSLLIIRISCIFCCMSLFIFFSLELSRTKKSIIFMHFKDQTILLLIKKTNYRLIKSENNC